jgi:hypothetical protein
MCGHVAIRLKDSISAHTLHKPITACAVMDALSQQVPTAATTQQPTEVVIAPSLPTPAPTSDDLNTNSVNLSTVISNITAVEFNATVFMAAVAVFLTTILPTAAATLQVVVNNEPPAAVESSLRSDSYVRHLQATDNSVTIAYSVTNVSDTATAAVIETQLPSKDSNDKLFSSYKALDHSTSATSFTTAVNKADLPGSKALPVGAIVGAVIGIMIAATISYLVWRKRDVLNRCILKKRTATSIDDNKTAVTSVTNTTSKTDSGAINDKPKLDSSNDVEYDNDVEYGIMGNTSNSGATDVTEKPLSQQLVQGISNIAQNAFEAHGHKVALAYQFGRTVAEHIPYVRHVAGLFSEVVDLFEASVHIGNNCAEVVAWGKDMQVCF